MQIMTVKSHLFCKVFRYKSLHFNLKKSYKSLILLIIHYTSVSLMKRHRNKKLSSQSMFYA